MSKFRILIILILIFFLNFDRQFIYFKIKFQKQIFFFQRTFIDKKNFLFGLYHSLLSLNLPEIQFIEYFYLLKNIFLRIH
jgi:hypothetical protein